MWSLLVGFLWSAFNVQTAFSASAILFIGGALIILRLDESVPEQEQKNDATSL
jgi:hypothetical protein